MNIGGVRLSELYKKITLEQNRNSKFLVTIVVTSGKCL